ncbi:MAG: FtsX-like permease family protein [Anaerolineaceae bacterium]|nr:FtsX-like permease family protein [Anaerolineaceae bacterium]
MMQPFLMMALKNLKRGGDRIAIAFLCISFGVLSLVSLTNVSRSLEQAFVLEPALLVGGDITATRSEPSFSDKEFKDLETWKAEGFLEDYTLIAYSQDIVFRKPDEQSWHYPAAGLGIDLSNYPMRGGITLQGQTAANPNMLLKEPETLFLTIDLAAKHKIKAGDHLVLALLGVGQPVEVKVAGILTDTPNHQGNKLYYSHETADKLANGKAALNTMLARSGRIPEAMEKLKENGWLAFDAPGMAASQQLTRDSMSLLLRGSGLLGLLVAGIGVANTMQVLLSRRKREIATWKMLGYSNAQTRLLFLYEAGIIGLVGSLTGAGLGVLLSKWMAQLFINTSTMLINSRIYPQVILFGVLIGLLTTLVFALWAIWRVENVSPASILRDETSNLAAAEKAKSLPLFLALFAAFYLLSAWVMQSPLMGLLAIAVSLLSLGIVGLVLKLLILLFSALLPLGLDRSLTLSKKQLRSSGLTPILAAVALFIGVLISYFSITAMKSGSRISTEAGKSWHGANMVILAPAKAENEVLAAVKTAKPYNLTLGYKAAVDSVTLSSEPEEDLSPILIGRDKPAEYFLDDQDFGSKDGVYVQQFTKYGEGDRVVVRFKDGLEKSLPIIGHYRVSPDEQFEINSGPLMSTSYFRSLVEPDQIAVFMEIGPENLEKVTSKFDWISSSAIAINLIERANRNLDNNRNIAVLGFAMAGLAFMAGLVLIANSVSLTLLSRRYEMGVQKAIGYSQWHLLKTLMVEYLIIAMVSLLSALGLVGLYILLLKRTFPYAAAIFSLNWLSVVLLALFSIASTLLIVAAVARKPLQVSPLVVLSDRE